MCIGLKKIVIIDFGHSQPINVKNKSELASCGTLPYYGGYTTSIDPRKDYYALAVIALLACSEGAYAEKEAKTNSQEQLATWAKKYIRDHDLTPDQLVLFAEVYNKETEVISAADLEVLLEALTPKPQNPKTPVKLKLTVINY